MEASLVLMRTFSTLLTDSRPDPPALFITSSCLILCLTPSFARRLLGTVGRAGRVVGSSEIHLGRDWKETPQGCTRHNGDLLYDQCVCSMHVPPSQNPIQGGR